MSSNQESLTQIRIQLTSYHKCLLVIAVKIVYYYEGPSKSFVVQYLNNMIQYENQYTVPSYYIYKIGMSELTCC